MKLKDRVYDYALLVVTIMLVLLGIIMVFSASFYHAENSSDYGYDGFYFFKNQIFGAVVGLAAMIFLMFYDYDKLGNFKLWGVVFALVLLGLVYIPGVGVEINGSLRWIDLGFITIQPSEIAKFFFIVFVAKVMDDNQDKIKKFKYGIWPVLLVVVAVCALILPQPNYSAIMIIVSIALIMMLVGGVRVGYLLSFLVLAGAVVAYAVMTQEHVRVRLFAFLTPEADPLGKGYQILQSLYAIGSGGAIGRGVGNSMQKFLYLPYGESDFIFSILCEELGFAGALGLIVLFIIFIYHGVRIAIKSPDVFGMVLATGITMMIGMQAVFNIAVATRSMPPTGVSLPFISYGRTALVMFMAEVGVLLNISYKGNAWHMDQLRKRRAR